MRMRLRFSKATASASDDNGEVREVEGHIGGGRVQVLRGSKPAFKFEVCETGRVAEGWTCDIGFS